jgi:hypothetical protein
MVNALVAQITPTLTDKAGQAMRLIRPHKYSWHLATGALALAILSACGGGGGSTTVSAVPTGVALSSPGSLDSSSNVVALALPTAPWDIRVADWGRAMWHAMEARDVRTAGHLLMKLMPISDAYASTSKVPEGAVVASEIEAVAKGTLAISHAGLLDPNDLFNGNATNANCFGPGITYTIHDNWTSGPNQSGSLPSGDLGMWTATNTDSDGTQPCATAELNKRLGGTKKQVRQAMLLMAGMRRIIEASGSLSLPAAGNTTDVQSALATALSAVSLFSGVTVDAATVSLNSIGTVYTYRLALSAGSGTTAKQGEIVIQHTPGASATQFSGVLQITTAQLGTDGAFGCSDQIDGGTSRYKIASVSTIRYDKNGTALDMGARTARYCGGPAPSSTSYIDDIASLDSDGMLDLSINLGGGNTRGSTKGWRGDASRFGATMATDTQAGDYIYVWQAGNNDNKTRAFAVHTTFNSSTEVRNLDAYFGYADTIDQTMANLDLQGMICNWAGPGNSHTPLTIFQSQSATLSSSASIWAASASHITYAPTTSCDSGPSMNFDADASTVIGSGEGASVTNDLDTLTGGRSTVAQELTHRGFTRPGIF